MLFRQVINEDLGCASYLVGDTAAGVAAVVDPQWEIEPYLRLARLHGVRIEQILETHNHADHVSGHGRLVAATGAAIHIHELAEPDYAHEPFGDGWTLELGEVTIEAVHTPGHRPEHTAFVLRDRSRGEEPWAALTGDSLFVGDVARPDLAVEPREGATDIFRSLQERLLTLDEEVEVWPGHLGGSMCGGSSLDHKTSTTIGYERAHNPLLSVSREEFVYEAVSTLGEKPPNVEHIVSLNRGPLVEDFGSPVALTPGELEAAIAEGAQVVDSRTNEQFDEAHIPGAISVSSGSTGFATWVARMVGPETEVVVVAGSDGYELEAAGLLAAVGLRVRGYLEGGMTAWREDNRPVKRIELIDPADLAAALSGNGDGPLVLDVRGADEFARAHIPGSVHIPYADLPKREGELPRNRRIAAVCSGGKRSGLAASVLQRDGFDDILHVTNGGVGTWQSQGNPVESA